MSDVIELFPASDYMDAVWDMIITGWVVPAEVELLDVANDNWLRQDDD